MVSTKEKRRNSNALRSLLEIGSLFLEGVLQEVEARTNLVYGDCMMLKKHMGYGMTTKRSQ